MYSKQPKICFKVGVKKKGIPEIEITLVYGLPSASQLNLLDLIENAAIRIAAAAFRTSPELSLSAETGIASLHPHGMTLTAKFLATASITIYASHVSLLRDLLSQSQNPSPSLQPQLPVRPPYNPIHSPMARAHSLRQSGNCLKFSRSLPSSIYSTCFSELLLRFQDPVLCYTDGS